MSESQSNGAVSDETRATAAEPVVSALRDGIPSADQLLDFGYWIGGYMGTCRSCGEQILNVGKRASRCKDCATKAFHENEHYLALERQNSLARFIDAVSEVDSEDVLIGGYLFRKFELTHVAQAIKARSDETQSGSVHESVVTEGDAPHA